MTDPVPVIDVVVPVHDEAHVLHRHVGLLHDHLAASLQVPWQITIAENASSDDTLAVARALATERPVIRVLHRDEPGRGGALREAWSTSPAEVLAYMDVDLSADLADLAAILDPVLADEVDLAFGSRLADGAHVTRSQRREVISRAYSVLIRTILRAEFHDAQCGFKAIRADVARRVLADVVDDGWFFDTELLVRAQRAGLRLREVPIGWVEDPDSRVRVVRTAIDDLRGIARLAWHRR